MTTPVITHKEEKDYIDTVLKELDYDDFTINFNMGNRVELQCTHDGYATEDVMDRAGDIVSSFGSKYPTATTSIKSHGDGMGLNNWVEVTFTFEKVYYDVDGNEKTLAQMVRCEPEWARNRIIVGEEAIEENEKLKQLKDREGEVHGDLVPTTFGEVKEGQEFFYPKEYNKGLIKLQNFIFENQVVNEQYNAASRDFGSLILFKDDTKVLVYNKEPKKLTTNDKVKNMLS